jgi:hypothetical protein
MKLPLVDRIYRLTTAPDGGDDFVGPVDLLERLGAGIVMIRQFGNIHSWRQCAD